MEATTIKDAAAPAKSVAWVIFDLDNCLANDKHRIPLIDWDLPPGDERYVNYHNSMWLDDVNSDALMLLNAHINAGRKIALFTARPEAFREMTKHWLSKFSVRYHLLEMRPDNDLRTSVALKRAMYLATFIYNDNHAQVGEADCADYAYDDHSPIVRMYQNEFGIEAAHVLKCHDVSAFRGEEAHIEPAPSAPPMPTIEGINTDMNDPALVEIIDRIDALEFKPIEGLDAAPQEAPARPRLPVGDVLRSMARTFDDRNKVYGDNFRMVAQLVKVLFPNGVPSELVVTDQWHLFELKLVKISRFAISNLTHIDSVHDDAVYSAMIEAILAEQQ